MFRQHRIFQKKPYDARNRSVSTHPNYSFNEVDQRTWFLWQYNRTYSSVQCYRFVWRCPLFQIHVFRYALTYRNVIPFISNIWTWNTVGYYVIWRDLICISHNHCLYSPAKLDAISRDDFVSHLRNELSKNMHIHWKRPWSI